MINKKNIKLKKALFKTINNFKKIIPMLTGILLLVSLLNNLLKDIYKELFTWNIFFDSLIWTVAWSISFGIPMTSYVIWWELKTYWVNLLAITAFVLAWTTVGLVMIPLEISFLGKKFAIYRNIINFFFAIIISILTVFTLKII